MLNIGPQELLVVLIIALVVVGPQRLPELGRSIGKALREFRKIQNDVKDTLRFDLNDDPEPHVAPRPKPHEDPNGSTASPDVHPVVAVEPTVATPADGTAASDPEGRPAPDADPRPAE